MRRLPLAWLVLAACAGGLDRGGAPVGAHVHRPAAGSAAERNAACERCHPAIAAEWRSSLHARSASDPVYARAFALEPIAFCKSCHDPHGDAALGTGCVTCHDERSASARARACGDCHEFAFPDGAGKMQLTATEHARSAFASTPCTGCHMPRTGGHASHAFPASRDPGTLRRAAAFEAARTNDGVLVTVTPREVGHALPTGDIFRRLRVSVEVPGTDTRRDVYLGRHTKRGEDRDDRPFAYGSRRSEIRVAIDARGPIRWSVIYERVEHPTSIDGPGALVDGAIELASGTL